MSYDFIYKLRPLRHIGSGWYKLAWKPIKGGTWNLYTSRRWWRSMCACPSIGFLAFFGGAINGWGRYWRDCNIRICLILIEIDFWIIWNIQVHKDGPTDCSEKRPLDLTGMPHEE